MDKHKWAIVAGAVTAAVVILVGLGFGVSQISAQGQATSPTATPEPTQSCNCNCRCDGSTRAEARRWGWQARGQVDIVAETLGMSTEDLTAALRDGKSVADVAKEKNVALDKVVEALLAPRREALAEAVSAGKLTQAQADERLQNMQEKITETLQKTGLPLGQGPAGEMMRAQRQGWQARGQVDIVAEMLGMSTADLTTAVRGGKSVADLAKEKNIALDKIVEALLAPRREALAEAVSAGKLTQAQADEQLQNMQERITEWLQQPGANKMMRPGSGMGRGSGGGNSGGTGSQGGDQ